MRALWPTYTLRVVVRDECKVPFTNIAQAVMHGDDAVGGHKFADPLKGKTGCDEALVAVRKALADAGIPAEVLFEKFEHT